MERLLQQFLNEHHDWSIKTYKWYQRRLNHFVTCMTITQPADITSTVIIKYLGDLRQNGYSWSTRNGAYTILNAWCLWLKNNDIIKANPIDAIKRPRKTRSAGPKTIPPQYIRQMVNAAQRENSLMALRDLAIMYLLGTTGIRRIELVRLSFNDLFLEQDKFLIRGKGDHQRWGFIRPDTRLVLNNWLDHRPESKSNRIFVSLKANKKGLHQGLNPDAINDIMICWRDKADLPDVSVSPHKWRHTFCTAIAKSKDVFASQILMGHTDIRITADYVHTDPDTLKQLTYKYGPKF